jgi:hypothetical protein
MNHRPDRARLDHNERQTEHLHREHDERSEPIGRAWTALEGERVDACDAVVLQVAQLVPDDPPKPE